jgi:hypothetical protein
MPRRGEDDADAKAVIGAVMGAAVLSVWGTCAISR